MIFSKKQKNLFRKKEKMSSAFVNVALEETTVTYSENGAKKYTTTNNAFLDQYASIGLYKEERPFSDIYDDFRLLYSLDPSMAIKFTGFIRTINRKTRVIGTDYVTDESQKGGELKHEAIMRMIALSIIDQDKFKSNIVFFLSLGSWKDIFQMLRYDLIYNTWENRQLDWEFLKKVIMSGLSSPHDTHLIRKYLPNIKSNSRCKTVEAQANNIIAKWLASSLSSTVSKKDRYKYYRKLKASGTAHEWQQLISRGMFDVIDFGKIPGRALNKLVNSKFLANQNLERKYQKWLDRPEAGNVIKYTGFVHELFKGFHSLTEPHKKTTIDRQFEELVKKGGEKPRTQMIVVRDTSGSMESHPKGANMSCYDIAKALALYFSEFLEGKFSNSWIEFNDKALMHRWKGKTPTDKWLNDRSSTIGSTNFQSVVDLFCSLREKGSINESEFPQGIICISDSEFDPSELDETNVQTARKKLRAAGFSKTYCDNFVIVLWNLYRGGSTFETKANANNTFYFGGYSPSTIGFLDGKITTAEELFKKSMDQEILNRMA